MTAGRNPVAVAALQYCAAGTAEETLRTLMPLIDRASSDGAKLICLPEAATFLAASRAALADEAGAPWLPVIVRDGRVVDVDGIGSHGPRGLTTSRIVLPLQGPLMSVSRRE